MAKGSWNKQQHVVPQAHQAMDNFKYEIAGELGLPVSNTSGEDYWGNVSSRDCGSVGGNMVRRMIAMAQQQMAGGTMMGNTGGSTMGSNNAGSMGSTGGYGYYGSNQAQGTTYNSYNDQYTNSTTTPSNYASNQSQGNTFSSGNDQKTKTGTKKSGSSNSDKKQSY